MRWRASWCTRATSVSDGPAGTVPVFLGFAPHGEDIDMDLYIDGELAEKDAAADAAPILALPSVDAPRRVTMHLFESLPDARVGQVA